MSLASPASLSSRSSNAVPLSGCDMLIGISKPGLTASKVLWEGWEFVILVAAGLAGMCLTLVTGSLSNLVAFCGLMALLSGTNVSEIYES